MRPSTSGRGCTTSNQEERYDNNLLCPPRPVRLSQRVRPGAGTHRRGHGGLQGGLGLPQGQACGCLLVQSLPPQSGHHTGGGGAFRHDHPYRRAPAGAGGRPRRQRTGTVPEALGGLRLARARRGEPALRTGAEYCRPDGHPDGGAGQDGGHRDPRHRPQHHFELLRSLLEL